MRMTLLEEHTAVALPILMRRTRLLAHPSTCLPTLLQSAAFPNVEVKTLIRLTFLTLKMKVAEARRRLLVEPVTSLPYPVSRILMQQWKLLDVMSLP
jgi:hypothetical protein